MNDVLTPEQYQQLLDMGMDNAQIEAAMEAQKAQANVLRGRGEMPQGAMAGRVFVPPSLFQYAGAMANQKVAGDKDRAAAAQQSAMGKNTSAQNQMVMRAILGQGQPMQQPGPDQNADPYARFRRAGGGA